MASTSRRNNRYTGVGQQDGSNLLPQPQPPTRQVVLQRLSTAQVLGALAILWIVVRVLYALPRFLDVLLGLAVASCLVVQWKQRQNEKREYEQEQARIERINREREETEATAHEAAQMMLDIDRQHLDEFIQKKNQQSSTYEEWISELHPDNVQESGAIDHRFYVHDSDHRLMWNGKADGVYRHPVEAKTADLV